MAASAAASCPLPPSITTRFGHRGEPLVELVRRHRPGAREAPRHDLGHHREVVLAARVADAELPVVRLLRQGVLEDDHRADRRVLLDVRDVEALDPDREALEVQRLAELLERLDAPRALALGLGGVLDERQLGVLARELLQAALLAALGGAHLDPRAAELGEVLLERVGRPDVGRDDDLRRDRRRAPVVLEEERLEELGDALALHVLQVERVAVDEAPAPEREDLDGGAIALGRDPDHVDRPDRALVGGLPLGQVPHREEPVPVAGGLLEALALGRVLHLALELADDRARVAREEADRRRPRSSGSRPRRRSRRRAPGSARCGSRGRECRCGARVAAPRRGGTGKTRFRTSSVSRTFFAFAYGPK